MQFVDTLEIMVKAGAGGDGMVAFRHEKYMPRGGPSGGDGGRGGSVVIQADRKLNTLVDLRYKKHYDAERAGDGASSDKHGKNGEDLVLRVPVGTIVYRATDNRLLADLAADGEKCIASKGGDGGRGNASYATATLQTPKFAEKGEPTEAVPLKLELKLLADVGLVGYPNVGKSTLISRISAAKPKIADYPFTTLVPNLGVVKAGDKSFVVADMPGLIEGAHEGAGLGHQFLRHIERTRIIAHLIDVSGFTARDPMNDFDDINHELQAYSDKLAQLPQIVVLNKCDIPNAGPIADALEVDIHSRGLKVFRISAVTGEGIDALVYAMAAKLDELPREAPTSEKRVMRFTAEPQRDLWDVRNIADGVFVIEGKRMEMLVLRTELSNEYALRRLHRQLDKMGVISSLRRLGAKHGDTVRIRDLEFDFVDEAYE